MEQGHSATMGVRFRLTIFSWTFIAFVVSLTPLLLLRYCSGAPHLNINLQMNYWHSLPGNIRECQEPLFDYMSALAINGRKTAQVSFYPFF